VSEVTPGHYTVVDNFPENGDEGAKTFTNVEFIQFSDELFTVAGNTGTTFYGGSNIDTPPATAGDDEFYGFGGNDVLAGDGGNDKLYGGDQNDQLNGGADNDLLDGGDGNDTMIGGGGDDRFFVSSGGDIVLENVGEGEDTIYTELSSYSLASRPNVENLVYITDYDATVGPLPGGLAFIGTGNDLGNKITGGLAGDTLNGGLGDDVLTGLAGNDTYFVDSSADQVVEEAGGGADTVHAYASFVLGEHIETLYLKGSATTPTMWTTPETWSPTTAPASTP
jgi:Ca2+-binding RTX toxin-like protein